MAVLLLETASPLVDPSPAGAGAELGQEEGGMSKEAGAVVARPEDTVLPCGSFVEDSNSWCFFLMRAG